MNSNAAAYFQDLAAGGKRVSLIGLGVSHTALATLFAGKGIKTTVFDKRERKALGEDKCAALEALGATLTLGPDYLDQLSGDVIFRSPGVNWHTPELAAARKNGAAITSEMETFFRLCPCRIIAVTGSDGKTTTTTLISEMLKKEGYTVHIGGNIGTPLLPLIETVQSTDIAVVELSSFQLISMRQSPDIAVVTNVTPNHLDVHGTMEEYIDAKRNVFSHQDGYGQAVFSADNAVTALFVNEARGRVSTFSRHEAVKNGAWFDEQDGTLFYSDHGSQTKIMSAADIRLPGLHNVENYLAAISAVWGLVSLESIRAVAQQFGGVEHRIEFVREKDGVKWYNDSIATSPTRTIAGLCSFNQKLIIIAGGYDKHIPYAPLAPYLLDKVKLLILTGATSRLIEEAVRAEKGFAESGLVILHAADLAEAVQLAHKNAKPGDIVSLSPASASFDCYPNFEVRGKHYKELVNTL